MTIKPTKRKEWKRYGKQRRENTGKKLLLLGTATSVFNLDYKAFDDIWGVGSAFGAAHADIKKIDLGFEIHPLDQIEKIAEERSVDYKKFDCPMMVQNHKDKIARKIMKIPRTFPIKELLKYIDSMGAAVRFGCSFDYMLIYAAMLGYKDITLGKILLTNDGEYFLERPGVEYWIEWLSRYEGITFHFPEDAEMFADSVMYGYEQRPNIWKLRSRVKHMWERHNQLFKVLEHSIMQGARAAGIAEAVNIIENKDLISDRPTKKNNENIKKIKELKIEMQKLSDQEQGKYNKNRDLFLQFIGGLQAISYSDGRN